MFSFRGGRHVLDTTDRSHVAHRGMCRSPHNLKVAVGEVVAVALK